MFQPNPAGPQAPAGDIVRIPFDRPQVLERFGVGQLTFPGGIAAGPDGELYVSINSLTFVPDTGAVVEVEFD